VKTIKRTRTHWARLSVDYYRDPKIIAVGPIGELAYLRLLVLARELVESSDVDGAVPILVATRELREVTDLWAKDNGGDFDSLIARLVKVGLVSEEEDELIVEGYRDWQTTRDEIEQNRLDARSRQQSSRGKRKEEDQDTAPVTPAKKAAPKQVAQAKTVGGRTRRTAEPVPPKIKDDNSRTSSKSKKGTPRKEAETMGVYDTKVEAFADLRDSGAVKKGNRKVGKHGLNPKQVADAETIVNHLAETRKEMIGGNFRVTDSWWADVRKLLTGTSETPGFTAGQVCDLIDYALSDKFWHAHCLTPAGLVKHGGKLYNSDDYIRWSKGNGRPADNRPRNTLIGEKGKPSFKGSLVADQTVDWSQESETW